MSRIGRLERLDQKMNSTDPFNQHRSRLHGIAYRMLGSVAEAEEVVQDAWLRWHQRREAELDSPEAWLVAVTTRLAIDRLRAAKVQREAYSGIWLPEPLLTDGPASPEQLHERADDVSIAFLKLLERLSPEARAAFLLREVFDVDYPDIARMLDKSEPTCRQLVSRARTQLNDERPRYVVPSETHLRLLRSFAAAATSGDFDALKSLLAESAELIGDGGGKVSSFPLPMVGGRRIAQLFLATRLRYKDRQRVELVNMNGRWGLLRFIEGALESAQSYETDGDRIVRIHVQRNPDKLARLANFARPS
jgi:RNA polymerase sigma-70 factor (ECF subfamily)